MFPGQTKELLAGDVCDAGSCVVAEEANGAAAQALVLRLIGQKIQVWQF